MVDKIIDPKKFYSLGEIVREELIDGIDTIQKASNLVQTDNMRNKILTATIIAYGEKGVRYRVLGRNIIKYLAFKDDQKK